MTYVDGFVLVVPKKNVAAYKKMASVGRKIWKKHGALDYKECIGDDLHPHMGGEKTATFPQIARAGKEDTVWFSFITYKSKAHRDAVNKKVMKDPAMNPEQWKDKEMPFDMKRFTYGGFKTIVEE